MLALIATANLAASGSITKALTTANLTYDTTDLSPDVLQMAEAYHYDIILLDLRCPDIEDYAVLRRLRVARVRAPILILSDCADPDCRTRGLGFGADDFLTKPFDAGELIARIRAIVRRSNGHPVSAIYTGKLVVDLDTQVATVDAQPVRLTAKEYALLEFMSLRKGVTISKEILLERLYGGMDEPNPKIIDVFVSKLRKKLARATGDHHYIETAWGRGYALRDPVPVPVATPFATLECLGGPLDEARTAEKHTVERAYSPPPQTALAFGLTERRPVRCRDGGRDHPVGRCRTPGIDHRGKVKSGSSSIEMWFEDAVTNDGGPLDLSQPEPAHSLLGCAAARCLE